MKQKAESTEKATETDTSNAEGSQTIGASSIVKKEWFPWAIVLLLVVIVGILAVALGTTKMGNQNNVEPNNENIAEVQNSQETITTDLTTTAATTTATKATTTATTTVTTTTTVATTAKPVVTTTAKPKPYVTASAKTFLLSGYDGSKVRLYLDGNFYKAYIKINGISYDTTVLRSDFSDYVELPFNPIANPETTLSVTPCAGCRKCWNWAFPWALRWTAAPAMTAPICWRSCGWPICSTVSNPVKRLPAATTF